MRKEVAEVQLGWAEVGVVEVDEADRRAGKDLLLVQVAVHDGRAWPRMAERRIDLGGAAVAEDGELSPDVVAA